LALDKKLMEIIVCPACHGELNEVNSGKGLKCKKCGLLYPVEDDIPVLLVDKAKKE
jgi:uncharacterized protein YbaR (Trm112 family)